MSRRRYGRAAWATGEAMKGIIFNLLEEAVFEHLGDAVWDELLDASGARGAYTSLGSYPDAEILALVGAAAAALGKTPAEVLRWFGQAAIPGMAKRYPALFNAHRGARDFLLVLNTIIHPEVRKLYPGAVCPHFRYQAQAEGMLVLGYNSPRKLCALAEGLILGGAAHYGETVSVQQRACMHDGAAACELEVQWAS